jgi:hypothetical protein
MIYPLEVIYKKDAIDEAAVQSVNNTLNFIQRACEEISNKFKQKITNIRADGGREFATIINPKREIENNKNSRVWFNDQQMVSNDLTTFLKESNIDLALYPSAYTNKNRVINKTIRTIRDMLGSEPEAIIKPRAVEAAVLTYNNNPHSAFDYEFSPSEVQSNIELEEYYIREKLFKLEEIKQKQIETGFFDYKPGNILLIHLDESKRNASAEKRRKFNKVVYFRNYVNSNVSCRPLTINKKGKIKHLIKKIEVSIYYTKLLTNSKNEIPPAYIPLIETLKDLPDLK